MPQKLGKGGHGPQNYVPPGNSAGGQYGDNETGSNKHFTVFKKPEEPKNNFAEGEPKKIYDGKGKEYLTETLTKKLSGKNGKLTPNGQKMLEQLSLNPDIDDDLSGVISDLFEKYPEIQLKLGKNFDAKYEVTSYFNYWTGNRWKEYKILLGSESLDGSPSYSKGGVFFHESGHALDNTFFDENGHRDVWSYSYKSKEFDKTLSEMMLEELSKFQDKDEFQKLKELANNPVSEEWLKYEKEYNELKEKRRLYNKVVMSNPQVVEFCNQVSKLSDEAIKLKKQMDVEWRNYNTPKYFELEKELKKKQDEVLEISKKNGELQNKLYAENFPQYAEEDKRYNELFDLKYELKEKDHSKIQVAYGDLSDMIEAVTGKNLTGMGHLSSDNNYWDAKGRSRGKEAFAEIMSAKATNPESLKVLQKYIPNSLKIFDEIIGEIRK
jgi:hypothetical protein